MQENNKKIINIIKKLQMTVENGNGFSKFNYDKEKINMLKKRLKKDLTVQESINNVRIGKHVK